MCSFIFSDENSGISQDFMQRKGATVIQKSARNVKNMCSKMSILDTLVPRERQDWTPSPQETKKQEQNALDPGKKLRHIQRRAYTIFFALLAPLEDVRGLLMTLDSYLNKYLFISYCSL